jgi:2,5-dioxopentanoate dehydrogenase
MITGKNYIGYTASAAGTLHFRTVNPALNEENEHRFIEATADEVDAAARLAAGAFPVYKSMSGKQRAVFLNAVADAIDALGDALTDVYCRESGLPPARAVGERGRTTGQLRAFAQMLTEGSWLDATIDTALPERMPAPKPDLRKMSIPIGPVAVFGASNFPLAYSAAGGDTASALAAGCPAIVKAHPMHAGTSELVASAILKAARETGMPDGVFSHLLAAGREVGIQLVKHPAVKGVGFTGSVQGGRALYDAAAQRPEPIPVFAEMGSLNPVIVLPSALRSDAGKWAAQLTTSITTGTGQFCTKPGLIIGLQGELLAQFTTALAQQIQDVPPGCMLHPDIHRNYERGQQTLSAQEGATVLAQAADALPPNFAQQKLLSVSGQAFLHNPALHSEVFGPFALIIECTDMDELRRVVESLDGQLTGTLLGDAAEVAEHPAIVSALQSRVGRLIFNGVPTGVEVCPSMSHGGPYPASTDSRFTAVGVHAVRRWVRPCSFQNWPDELLPPELQNSNPLNILRLVNNQFSKDAL